MPESNRAKFVIGDAERAGHVEAVRGGEFSFTTRRGLAPSLRLLVEGLPKALSPESGVLVGLSAVPGCGLAGSRLWPDARITHFEFDVHAAARARAALAANDAAGVAVACAADLPGVEWPGGGADGRFGGRPFAAIALPFPRGGDAMLARELVEEAHLALIDGGALYASTDNRDTRWLSDLLDDLFEDVDAVRREPEAGAVFRARRGARAARAKDRRRTYSLEVGSRMLAITTRPGTFSHGRLDAGSAALIDSAAFERAVEGARAILDIGCGVGVLGLVAATLADASRLVLLDSSARAADLARANADANEIASTAVVLSADAAGIEDGAFDLALANPPYFGDFRVAEHFVKTAARALGDDGCLILVAKERDHHAALIAASFEESRREEIDGYGVFAARRPRRAARDSGRFVP